MKSNVASVFLLLVLTVSSATADTLTIWRDCSASMSEQELASLLPLVVTFVEAENRLQRIEVIRFSCPGRRTFTETAQVFELGDVPSASAPNRTGGLADWFKSRAESAAADAARRTAEELSAYRSQRASIARIVAETLQARPVGTAACTEFDAAAVRIAEEDRPFNLVLTDMWLDCPIGAQKAPRMTGKLAVVLVPRNGDPVEGELQIYNSRSRSAKALFPDARIVKPYMVSRALAEFWN